MKAVVLTGTGGPEALQVLERPDPALGPGGVRVAVQAAGINFADTLARVGLYPDAPKRPCVLGYEVAGEVEAVGEGVSSHTVGERVIAVTRFGGQAELVTVPEAQVLPLPERLSFEQGAAFPVNYGTASPSKHDAIRAQGVVHPIDYRSQDFEAEVMRITGGEGVDLVIDALGPTSFRKDYRLLRSGGRLVMYGLSESSKAGARDLPATFMSLAKMPLATLPWWKSLAVMNENKGVFGLNMLKWWDREGNLDRVTRPLMADLEDGRLEPVVAEAFPFERAGEAHEFIAERRNLGKVVLVPS